MEAAERWAYGPLGLTPTAFAACTPREFERLCAGYRWREERMADRMATLITAIANFAGFGRKRPLSEREILRRALGDSRVPGYRVLPPRAERVEVPPSFWES